MKIATWNVNSLNVRLSHVIDWVVKHQPDILCLQETKQVNDKFDHDAFSTIGYHSYHNGQKTYNGVAIISKNKLIDINFDLPDFDDPQKRIISGLWISDSNDKIYIVSAYVPNGQTVGSDKFIYKMSWLNKFSKWVTELTNQYDEIILTGDFNIAPENKDCHDPDAWIGQILVSTKERKAFNGILNIGFHDSYREINPNNQEFSWWDYRMAGFRRNLGMRIDHILVSKNIMPKVTKSYIDKEPRKLERPSDHTPVVTEL
ncbi:exodeoxyribonuclease III [Methylophilaceae bacterium]|nr:exodeoxyribonuclease III [Methylophilaceae bacterium]